MISVIVPIYNVEKYLIECLESIRAQSYSDFEVLLVDDGSSDSSGIICDKYAQIDSRFISIHKNNGGVSSARNTGLIKARGEYIGFVDPDDYVEKDYLKSLLEHLLESNASIVVCNYDTINDETEVLSTGKNPEGCFETVEAVTLLLEDEIVTSYLWNKLFKKEVFSGLSFQEGKRYEDVRIMHKLFLRADSVVTYKTVMYHYRVRTDSITHSTTLLQSQELLDGLDSRCTDLVGTEFYPQAILTRMIQTRRVLLEIQMNGLSNSDFYNETIGNLKRMLRNNYRLIPKKQRIKFIIFCYYPQCYKILLGGKKLWKKG